jgi:hypothetical protein
MSKHLPIAAAFIVLVRSSSPAQVLDSLVPSGYQVPTAIVAPGQVVRLFVQGVGASLTGPVLAASLPLPTTLAGISVMLQESHGGTVDHFLTAPVPIFGVAPFSSCGWVSLLTNPLGITQPCNTFAAITVQIPFELLPTGVGVPDDCTCNYGVELTISEGGVPIVAVAMNTYTDSIHVITGCDSPNLATALETGIGNAGRFFTCDGLAFHSNGVVVTANQPAQPGEQLVMYAVGLGATAPPAQTGQPSPSGSTASIQIVFDFTINARPKPTFNNPTSPNLVFAGLSPG